MEWTVVTKSTKIYNNRFSVLFDGIPEFHIITTGFQPIYGGEFWIKAEMYGNLNNEDKKYLKILKIIRGKDTPIHVDMSNYGWI